jgi:hypothetical protein
MMVAKVSESWPSDCAMLKAYDDRIRSFDAYRARVLGLPDAIAVASPARREELCRIVIERIVVSDRRVDSIVWTPPARPFFEKQRVCPQGDSNP